MLYYIVNDERDSSFPPWADAPLAQKLNKLDFLAFFWFLSLSFRPERQEGAKWRNLLKVKGILRLRYAEFTPSYDGARNDNGIGLPLDNLTSKLFANVYLNVFDQWIKHKLKAKHYIRYADDFVILSPDKKSLVSFIPAIKQFLAERLRLELHRAWISWAG